jgi:poly-gamma-glutamate synthesis protein (capsule biosynthesis protein)
MQPVEFVFAGDLILDEPDPDHWLRGIAAVVGAADISIGHLEVPHTTHTHETIGDIPAPGSDPAHVSALRRAGFRAVSLAGNHMADCGPEGIRDTIAALKAAGLRHAGAGMNLAEATAPALITSAESRAALLSYNCVGPELSWASERGAGCAYIRVETANGAPITPSAPLERPNQESLALVAAQVAAARRTANVVIVSLHKGIVHTPAKLARYERPVAQAAIDAGADIVVCHHAHIVRGIELYRGRPIFHGLGNGCVVTRALSPDQSRGSDEAKKARAAWARKRRELFGFEPDPAYYLAPFHPEAINGMLGSVRLDASGLHAGFVPLHVEPPGRPTIARNETARDVIDYIERITTAAGLPPIRTRYDGQCAWLT